jgi:hypothetical protein
MVQGRRTIFPLLEIASRCYATGLYLKYFQQGFTRCASACVASAPLGFEPFDGAHGPEDVEGLQRLEFLTGFRPG